MSDARPQLGDLSLELDQLTWAEVMKMAVHLGMEFAALQKIGESADESIRLLTTMDAWLKADPGPSWGKVVRALRAIKKSALAQKLEEKYCKPVAAAGTEKVAASPDDLLTTMFEELLPAQNSSHLLGLKLGLAYHVIEAIHSQHADPRNRLLHVLTEFLKQVDPATAWSSVVRALKSPAVHLTRLAKVIEERHCPSSLSPPRSSSLLTSRIYYCASSPPPVSRVLPPSGPPRHKAPSLPMMMHYPRISGDSINIIEKIGPNHRTFGVLLLEDAKGEITDAIFQSELGRPAAIVHKIMMRWLQGTGREPRTWDTLVTVLEEAELRELASDITDNLT